MEPGHRFRRVRVSGGARLPPGNRVILRTPKTTTTSLQKRKCAVIGLQFGTVILQAKKPLPVKVYRSEGYWVHELEEFHVWAAEQDFDTSREYFQDHLLWLYQDVEKFTPETATSEALALRSRLLEAFEEVVPENRIE